MLLEKLVNMSDAEFYRAMLLFMVGIPALMLVANKTFRKNFYLTIAKQIAEKERKKELKLAKKNEQTYKFAIGEQHPHPLFDESTTLTITADTAGAVKNIKIN